MKQTIEMQLAIPLTIYAYRRAERKSGTTVVNFVAPASRTNEPFRSIVDGLDLY